MVDTLRLVPFNRKPENGELYMCEYGFLYKCHNRKETDKLGFPGKEIKTVIPCLEKTTLNLIELEALKEFVWNKKLRDGMNIELKFTFNTI